MSKMSQIDAEYQSAMQFRELGNNESESELVANKEMQGVRERSNQYDKATTWEGLDKFDNSYDEDRSSDEDKAPTIPNSLSSIKVSTYYYVTDDGSLCLDIESMAAEYNEKMENVEQAFIEMNNKNKYTYNDEGRLIRRNNGS
jgi:hypothetical protein